MHADEVLQRWQDDESVVRKNPIHLGVATREQVANQTGLQVLQRMIAGELPAPPICETLNFILVRVAQGQAVFQGKPLPTVLNPMGSVHGGWYAALLDSAMGCAVHTTMPVGRGYTTLEFKINIVRAIAPKVALVRAEGATVHVGKQVATAEARLVGPDGTLYAHASTTCLVFELPKA